MLGEIRQRKLVELLMQQESVRISELSGRFAVSEETIRRDLKKLEAHGLLKRTHGGAVSSKNIHEVPSIALRSQQHLEQKRMIARMAVSKVVDGATVMLDSGTTTLEIARSLVDRPVTVLTNDLNIAMELSQSLHVQLVVLGGVHQKGGYSVTGPECVDRIRNYHVDIAFLGAGGIDVRAGLTTASSEEAQVKRAMIASAETAYCAVDASKFGRSALVSYALPQNMDGIVTDAVKDNETVLDLQDQDIKFFFV